MNKKLLICIFFLGLFSLQSVRAVVGVDVADPTDVGTFQCLIENYGIQFTITRGYKSIGQVDYNAIGTNINAKSVGLITDVYLFPCMDVDPSDTASDFVNNMVDGNGNDVYGTVWIDVEHNPSSRCAWSSDTDDNCSYLSNLVSSLQSYGKLVGIYSSKYQWDTIFGDFDNCANFTSLPIWYAHYDGKASFSDWYNGYSFGGWSDPAIKQYAGDQTACGSDVDFNYY